MPAPPAAGPRPGADPGYAPIQEVVERIWTGAELLCGKRLAPAGALWLPHYARYYGSLSSTRNSGNAISEATLDRLVASPRRADAGA